MGTEDLDELEFENTRLHTKLALVRLDGVLLNTDRLLSMYNHVNRYGIDRTFLALNNGQNLLDKLCETQFPGCEDILSDYDLNKCYFEACMEGLGKAIGNAFDWVVKKIKELCSWIAKMWRKFFNLFKSAKNKEKAKKLRSAKLYRKISARVNNKGGASSDPGLVQKLDALRDIYKKSVDSAGNRTKDNQFDKNMQDAMKVFDGLKAVKKSGKADDDKKETTEFQIVDDASKNTYLNLVMNKEDHLNRVVDAIGSLIVTIEQSIAVIERNIATQQANTNAHKQEKIKKDLKDKDQKIKDKWVKHAKCLRGICSVLSTCMKDIMNEKKLMNDNLKLIANAVKNFGETTEKVDKTNKAYEEQHGAGSLT